MMIDSRQKLNSLTSDLNTALRQVAEMYNLEFEGLDVRRSRDGSFVRIMKLDMNARQVGKSAPKGDSTLDKALKQIGVSKKTSPCGKRIIEYKASRPKYPFVVEGPKGGRWKFTAAQVKMYFA